jgi:hypothetical protein
MVRHLSKPCFEDLQRKKSEEDPKVRHLLICNGPGELTIPPIDALLIPGISCDGAVLPVIIIGFFSTCSRLLVLPGGFL